MQKRHFFPFVSALCFSTGFYPIPREKPGELLEGNFFFFSQRNKNIKSKRGEFCKSLFWSWSVSHRPGTVWPSHLRPPRPFSSAAPVINWSDSSAICFRELVRTRERQRGGDGEGRKRERGYQRNIWKYSVQPNTIHFVQ